MLFVFCFVLVCWFWLLVSLFFGFFFFNELLKVSLLNARLSTIQHPQDLMRKERLGSWTCQGITLQPPVDPKPSHAISVVT